MRLENFALQDDENLQCRAPFVSLASTSHPITPDKQFSREKFEDRVISHHHHTPTLAQKERKSRCPLRQQLGMVYKLDDTPRKKFLIEKCTSLSTKLQRATRERTSLRRIHKDSQKMDNVLKIIQPKVSAEAFEFLRAQIYEGSKEPRGRRYSLDLKILSVALWKSGPRAYSLMSEIFVLPGKRTLQTFLQKFDFNPGFNFKLIAMLLDKFRHMPHKDRFVNFMWDGTGNKPHLFYDAHLDQIMGYEDFGNGERSKKVSTEFLVFMVTSVNHDKKKWKQPLAYINCSKSLDAKFLARQVLFYLTVLVCIGLRPVATICDQHPTNVKAVKILQESDENPVLKFCGISVVLTFDTPHQLKCLRNLLMKNNLHTGDGIVKFKYFLSLYKYDLKNFPRHCWKLSEVHLCPTGKCKMKVCYAAQLFSRCCGLYMQHLINTLCEEFPPDAAETVAFIFFIDHWFDSVNGKRRSSYSGNK
jgi:Transposase protein